VQDESSGQHRGAGREILLANFSAWVRTKREQFQEKASKFYPWLFWKCLYNRFRHFAKMHQPFAQTKPTFCTNKAKPGKANKNNDLT
jgi:hypothetical protein